MEQWKTIEPGMWKPQQENDSIVGVLVSKEPADRTKDISAKYMVENADGVHLVWGSAVLDDKMQVVAVGSKIRITYLGKKELPKNKTLNQYKVEVSEKK